MKVKELIEKLQKADPEVDVFFRKVNGVGNIQSCDKAVRSTYGFFGISIPCVLLEPAKSDHEGEDIPYENEL